MIVGITSAASELGRSVTTGMKARIGWRNVVALARSSEEVSRLEPVKRGLVCDTPGKLASSLAKVDRVVIVAPRDPGPSEAWHAGIIEAAKAAGVGRIVYMSLLHADTSPIAGAAAHLRTEALIAASGIPATILRVGCFAEDFLRGAERVVAAGTLPGSAGDAPFHPAAISDYAFAAGAVTVGDGHEGLIYELAGDRPWTLAEIAAEIGWQTYCEVVYEHLAPRDHAAAMRELGLSAEEADARVALDAAVAEGTFVERGRQLGRLRGNHTQSLITSVWRALAPRHPDLPAFRGIRPGTELGRLKAVRRSLSTPRRFA